MSLNNTDIVDSKIFVKTFNAITGKTEWQLENEAYDYHQEIARSSYADMLHDKERNQKYYEAMKVAISRLHAEKSTVRVLDIGTGTGLLSLMAAKLGADEITACEAFSPMAACAKNIIHLNGFADKINLVAKRSTELVVGIGGDMKQRANLLVTEVFDTELIGEGAIQTFNHAHEHLLEENCLVVPSRATVYVQLIESNLLKGWNRPLAVTVYGSKVILPPDEVNECWGSAGVLDLQLSQLPTKHWRPLTDTHCIARFDFASNIGILPNESHVEEIIAKDNGVCHAIFFWWDLDMDPDGDIVLSCAPSWSHPNGENQPWRDHWMQAVYFPLKNVGFQRGDVIKLRCSRDDYSFWFYFDSRFSLEEASERVVCEDKPLCTCALHAVCNYSRIGIINDSTANAKYISVLQKVVKEGSVCLFLGETSLLPLMAVQIGARKVYVIDHNYLSARMLQAYLRKNNLDEYVKIIEKSPGNVLQSDIDNMKIDVIICEPFFTSSLLPWHNLYFWYATSESKALLEDKPRIMPIGAELYAVSVCFKDLWKIRSPVKSVEGFNTDPFSKLIEDSVDIADNSVEPHPLWEYESVALSKSFLLLSFDFTQGIPTENLLSSGLVPLMSGDCNGVCMWMEWKLDEETTLSRGPTTDVNIGERIQWDINSKQGVYFIKNNSSLVGSSDGVKLGYDAIFNTSSGTLKFKFNV